MFLPPLFDLFEFEQDGSVPRGSADRRLLHANGLVKEPADQVLLGWTSSESGQAAVATRRCAGPVSVQESGRWDAIHLAANHSPDGLAPLLSLGEWQSLQATSGEEDPRWRTAAITVDGRPATAEAIEVNGGSFGWTSQGDRVVAFALWAFPLGRLRLRTLTPALAKSYLCNPLMPRTWHEFVACNSLP